MLIVNHHVYNIGNTRLVQFYTIFIYLIRMNGTFDNLIFEVDLIHSGTLYDIEPIC